MTSFLVPGYGPCPRGFSTEWYNDLVNKSTELGYTTVTAYEYWFSVNTGQWTNHGHAMKFPTIEVNRKVILYFEPSTTKGHLVAWPSSEVTLTSVPLVWQIEDGWRKIIWCDNRAYWIKF